MPPDDEYQIISGANGPSFLAWIGFIILLLLAVSIKGYFGNSLENSMFYDVYGKFIYLLFYGGLLYGLYEFVQTYLHRKSYVWIRDGLLHIYAHRPILLGNIKKVELTRKLWVSCIRITEKGGQETNIKSYLLDRDAAAVARDIQKIAKLPPGK